MSSKRKGRIIQIPDDDGLEPVIGEEAKRDGARRKSRLGSPLADMDKLSDALPVVPSGLKFGRSKPAKPSTLRKSIVADEVNVDGETRDGSAAAAEAEDASGAPVVVRPYLTRSGSTKLKKRATRLSFTPSDSGAGADDEAEAATSTSTSTPRKTLGQRALENKALRWSSSVQLPDLYFGEDEQPRYSRAMLEELQISTPSTPQNVASLRIDDDAMDLDSLDPSELEGALVVPSEEVGKFLKPAAARILTEPEIRERKERRARLAHEEDMIMLESDEEEQVTHFQKKAESRLVAEDEDVGEGYDDFVSDGRLALGKKAEREARRRHRQEMADLIRAADEDVSDDSEAERLEAYEAAQRRAGMDGLERQDEDDEAGDGHVIPRMNALPELKDVMERMRGRLRGLEEEVTRRRKKLEELAREKVDLVGREEEVQQILDQAGEKYKAAIEKGADGSKLPVERGLESFGTPPTGGMDGEIQ